MRPWLAAVAIAIAALPTRAADPVAGASARAVRALRASLRSADALHARAVADVSAALRRGTSPPRVAFDVHASALALLSARAAAAAAEAESAVVAEASAAMAEASDASLRGAVPGTPGTLEDFVPAVRREIARVRARAGSRLRALGRAFAGARDGRTEFRARFPEWAYDLATVPSPAGPVEAGAAPPRLRAVSAARLPDGRLVVAACGTAAPGFGGAFDVRLRGAAVVVLPPKLSDGGVAVASDGTWSLASELGDPFDGTVPEPGNRVLQFGTEPFDGGLAGRQPGRLVAAGVLGIP